MKRPLSKRPPSSFPNRTLRQFSADQAWQRLYSAVAPMLGRNSELKLALSCHAVGKGRTQMADDALDSAGTTTNGSVQASIADHESQLQSLQEGGLSRTNVCRMKNAMKLGICNCKTSGEKCREICREKCQALLSFVS